MDKYLMHKHIGVTMKNGKYLRPHPVSRVHTDDITLKYHNAELKLSSPDKNSNKKTTVKKAELLKDFKIENNDCECTSLDYSAFEGVYVEDGWLVVEVEELNIKHKGVRVKFIHYENKKRRTVGVEIPKAKK